MAVRPNARTRKNLQSYQGQPVCILMKDGSYYVGLIGDIKGGELTLSGVRGSEKWNPQAAKRSWQKARISALGAAAAAAPAAPAAPGAAAGTGAGSAAGVSLGSGLGGLGGLDDLMGFMQKALPLMKMGMDMIKTIMPLMSGLKM